MPETTGLLPNAMTVLDASAGFLHSLNVQGARRTVDLDASRAYVHRNGEWAHDAPPDRPRGIPLDQTPEAIAEVVGSSLLSR